MSTSSSPRWVSCAFYRVSLGYCSLYLDSYVVIVSMGLTRSTSCLITSFPVRFQCSTSPCLKSCFGVGIRNPGQRVEDIYFVSLISPSQQTTWLLAPFLSCLVSEVREPLAAECDPWTLFHSFVRSEISSWFLDVFMLTFWQVSVQQTPGAIIRHRINQGLSGLKRKIKN